MLIHLSRFVEWTNTNYDLETNSNDRTPFSWPEYTLSQRNPWKTIPFIVNQMNKSIDIWINIPHHVSDDSSLK